MRRGENKDGIKLGKRRGRPLGRPVMCPKPSGFQGFFHLLGAPGMVLGIFQRQLYQTLFVRPRCSPPQSLSLALCSCPPVSVFCAAKGSIVCQRTDLGHMSCSISKASASEYSHPLTASQWLTDVRGHKPGSLASKVRTNPAVWFMFQSSPQDHAEAGTSSEITPLLGFFLFRVLSPPTSPNSRKHFRN